MFGKLTRRSLLGLVPLLLPFLGSFTFSGCGDDNKPGTVVAPNEQSKTAEANMEEFMRSQNAAKGKTATKK